jgi:hypothetical protein
MKRILREIEEKSDKDNPDTALQEDTEEGHCQKDETEQHTDTKEVQQVVNKWENVKAPG